MTRTQTEPINEAVIAALADAGMGHDEVPSVHEVPFRYPRREAATLKAQMIQKGELAGTPADVLALIEAIPPDERDPNCDYLLGKIYMKSVSRRPVRSRGRRGACVTRSDAGSTKKIRTTSTRGAPSFTSGSHSKRATRARRSTWAS